MLLFGLLLVAVTGAFTGLLIADNLAGGPEYQVTILGTDLVTLNSLGIFLAGLALALLFCLGLALMRAARRARLFRRTPRHDRRTAAGTRAPGTEERTADERLTDERAPDAPVAGGAGAGGGRRLRHLLGR
ncbi:hypothetical protein [Kitasatospora purpeofusca]|uniref:hypothetical protein n=1 Tax=Kitasatospora purpeofusca TaxID=67352 RepID=UPI0036D418AA